MRLNHRQYYTDHHQQSQNQNKNIQQLYSNNHKGQYFQHSSNQEYKYTINNKIEHSQQPIFTIVNPNNRQKYNINEKTYILMRKLKQSIKQLCLTNNAYLQVEELLQKQIKYFKDTLHHTQNIQTEQNHYNKNNKVNKSKYQTNKSKSKSKYEYSNKNTKKQQSLYNQIPLLNKLLQSIYPGSIIHEQNLDLKINLYLSNYQYQILQQFLRHFINLLQKQINRISRYKGQKKLKYLLQTVMKEIFQNIMKYTFQIKLYKWQKQKNNKFTKKETKINILSNLINSIIISKYSYLKQSFEIIKYHSIKQYKKDSQFVTEFQLKVASLDYILKINQRKSIRSKFLKWRQSAYLIKKVQQQQIYLNLTQMVQNILFQFAQNQHQLNKWKSIIWNQINQFVKKLTQNMGYSVLFPVNYQHIPVNYQHIYPNNQSNSNSIIGIDSMITSNVKSVINETQNQSDSYRYLKSQNVDQDHQAQIELLQQIHNNFTKQQINNCLKSSSIIMNHPNAPNMLLIPIKLISGIIGIKYYQNQQYHHHPVNISHFYSILSALQIASPILLQVIHLQQKFQYFDNKIRSKIPERIVLSNLVKLKAKQNSLNINDMNKKQNQIPINNRQSQYHMNNRYSQTSCHINNRQSHINNRQSHINNRQKHYKSICLQIQALSHRAPEQLQQNQKQILIQNCLFNLGINKMYLYHLKNNKNNHNNNNINTIEPIYYSCINFNIDQRNLFNNDSLIGSSIIEAIFSQFNRFNKIQQNLFIPIRTNNTVFYAFPILYNQSLNDPQIIGVLLINSQKFTNITNKQNLIVQNQFYSIIQKNKKSKYDQFKQEIILIKDGLIPMIIQNKYQQLSSKYTKNCNQCQYCNQILKSQNIYLYKKLTNHENNIISQHNFIDKNNDKLLDTQQMSQLINKTIPNLGQQNYLYNLQCEVYKFYKQKILSFNQQLHKNQINYLDSAFQDINQFNNNFKDKQVFMKVFYPVYPFKKDGKKFINNKQDQIKLTKQQSKNQAVQYYYFSNMKQNQLINTMNNKKQINKSYLKLSFIDKLALFHNKKSDSFNKNQHKIQSLDINLSKVIQVYKKGFGNKILKQQKQVIMDDMQILIQQILYSIILSRVNKQYITKQTYQQIYHSLDLLFYQLQNINKNHNKVILRLNFHPIFSYFQTKSRYLTGLVCIGNFIINDNQNHHNYQYINHYLNQFITHLNKNILGNLIEKNILIKKQHQQQKQIIKTLLNKNKQIKNKINNHQFLPLLKKSIQNDQINQNQNQDLIKLKIYQFEQSHKQENQKDQQDKNTTQNKQFTLKIIKNIINLNDNIKFYQKHKLKSIVIHKFKQNSTNSKLNIIEKMNKVLTKKIQQITNNNKNNNNISKRIFQIKQQMYAQFFEKLVYSNSLKCKKYVQNCIQFQNKITQILIINKIFKFVFNRMKSKSFVNKQKHDKLKNDKQISISKQFGLQRIFKILIKRIYQSPKNILSQSFNSLKCHVQFYTKILSLQKIQAIYSMTKIFPKIICRNSYLSFFVQLQKLQRSLFENISLLGSEIQFMNFYSISNFLKFINERINIIIKSQQNLIRIIYGEQIQNVQFYLIIKQMKNSYNNNDKIKLLKLKLSDELQGQKIINQQLSISNNIHQYNPYEKNVLVNFPEYFNYSIYLSFKFIPSNQKIKQGLMNSNFLRLHNKLTQITQNKILLVFQQFFILYSKKLQTFSLKLNKIFKIPSFIYNYSNLCRISINLNNQDQIKKQFAFKKLINQMIRKQKMQQNKQLQKQIKRKKTQYEQLQNIYNIRQKIMHSLNQNDLNRLINNNDINKSINIDYLNNSITQNKSMSIISNNTIDISTQRKDSQNSYQQIDTSNIISKCHIKQIQQNIQNLQQNYDKLSIQYQIKSKTTSGYQIINYLNKKQHKQALQTVKNTLMNNNTHSLDSKSLNQQKQYVNLLKSIQNERKNQYDQKYKTVGLRTMTKIVNNMKRNSLKQIFYKINSYNTQVKIFGFDKRNNKYENVKQFNKVR